MIMVGRAWKFELKVQVDACRKCKCQPIETGFRAHTNTQSSQNLVRGLQRASSSTGTGSSLGNMHNESKLEAQ
jgi:hypothetical protein